MARRPRKAVRNVIVSELSVLQAEDVTAIDQALGEVGPDGQIHLIMDGGRLSLIRMLENEPIEDTSSTEDTR